MENRYKKIREDFEFTEKGYRLTTKNLAEIFKAKGYSTLTDNAIRKIETGKRNVSEYELHGYCEVFNTTSDYLLGFTNVSSTDREALAISSVTGLSDKSLNELKQYSAFQRTFTDKLISSKALLKIMEAYIYRNSYLFHKIEITDEFIKKVTLSNDENKNYHYYRSEQLLRDALNVLDNDIELFNTLNHSHTKNMWTTVIDFCIETQDIDNLLAYFKKNKAAIPATVIEYAQLKAKGSDKNEIT